MCCSTWEREDVGQVGGGSLLPSICGLTPFSSSSPLLLLRGRLLGRLLWPCWAVCGRGLPDTQNDPMVQKTLDMVSEDLVQLLLGLLIRWGGQGTESL